MRSRKNYNNKVFIHGNNIAVMLNDGFLEKINDATMKHIAGSNEEKDNKYHRDVSQITMTWQTFMTTTYHSCN